MAALRVEFAAAHVVGFVSFSKNPGTAEEFSGIFLAPGFLFSRLLNPCNEETRRHRNQGRYGDHPEDAVCGVA